MRPTYLDLAFSGNFVCRKGFLEWFTYCGKLFIVILAKHGKELICESKGTELA